MAVRNRRMYVCISDEPGALEHIVRMHTILI